MFLIPVVQKCGKFKHVICNLGKIDVRCETADVFCQDGADKFYLSDLLTLEMCVFV